MKRILNALLFIGLLAVVAGLGIYAGYNAINIRENKPMASPFENAVSRVFVAETDIANNIATDNELSVYTESRDIEVISADAVLKFEYSYRNDGTSITTEQKIPYFLVGKAKSELEEVFPGWKIREYSTSGAVFVKELEDGAKQNYLVTITGGYIAVYYDEGIDGSKLKEMTDTPVSALAQEEAQRLEAGVSVRGEDSLMRLLEDLSS